MMVVVVFLQATMALGTYAAEKNDPVELFKSQILEPIKERASQPKMFISRSITTFNDGRQWDRWTKKRFTYLIGFDIQKTNSLVAPLVAVVNAKEIWEEQQNSDGPSGDHSSRESCLRAGWKRFTTEDRQAKYNFIDGSWVPARNNFYWPLGEGPIVEEDSLGEKVSVSEGYKSTEWRERLDPAEAEASVAPAAATSRMEAKPSPAARPTPLPTRPRTGEVILAEMAGSPVNFKGQVLTLKDDIVLEDMVDCTDPGTDLRIVTVRGTTGSALVRSRRSIVSWDGLVFAIYAPWARAMEESRDFSPRDRIRANITVRILEPAGGSSAYIGYITAIEKLDGEGKPVKTLTMPAAAK